MTLTPASPSQIANKRLRASGRPRRSSHSHEIPRMRREPRRRAPNGDPRYQPEGDGRAGQAQVHRLLRYAEKSA